MREGGVCAKDVYVDCSLCHRSFPNRECYSSHLEKPPPTQYGRQGFSVCETLSICQECGRQVSK